MSMHKLFSLFAVATVLAAARGVHADSPANTCFLSHKPSHVLPYEIEHSSEYERIAYKTLAGAHVFIPAEPGLTGEWLRSQLDRRAALASKPSDCPLDVRGVSVSVQSGGPGFWVTIATGDRKNAEEVLRRAQRVVR